MWKLDPDHLDIQWKYKSGDGVVAICENPDHDDNHPSMYVDLIEDFFYCFSCTWTGKINKLLHETQGIKRYTKVTKPTKDLIDNEWKGFLSFPIAYDDVTLVARDITNNIVDEYELRHSEDKIIIPLKNNYGEIVGVKIRMKNKLKSGVKYLTFGQQPQYISNTKFLIAKHENPIGRRVWVTEGMFGLMRLSHEGLTGLTPLSANRVNSLYNLFKSTPYNDYILAFDPDYAGCTSVMKMLYDCRGLDNVFAPNTMVDIDELSSEAIHELMCSDWSKTCTQSFSKILNFIDVEFGEDVYRKAVSVIAKHIEYDRK